MLDCSIYSAPFVIFLFGSVVGSFLNCVIYRLEKKESFLGGRSYCPDCRHTLSWQDLMPVLSFLILRGRCRYCQKTISWQYPLVELATGTVFVLISLFTFSIQHSIYSALISCFLIVVFVYDLKHYIIPDKVILPAVVLALAFNLFMGYKLFSVSLAAAFGAALFFLAIVLISQGRWMGMGDVKLAFLMGLFLSFPAILAALFSAFFIGAIIGIGLMLLGRKSLKSEVPFGPFLVTGTFLALFFGKELIGWYLNFLII